MWKDIFREIWRTKTRFLSILTIILLGVAFFAGISATEPVMIRTADIYFDDQRLMDIHVLSTMGLNDEDLEALDELEDATVEPFFAVDVVFDRTGLTSKVFGFASDEEQQMNQYVVRDGRLPESSGEIALDYTVNYRHEYAVGDTVRLETGTADDFEENFEVTEFEVVGFVHSPLYVENVNRGNTQVGTGSLDGFSVILEDDFNLDYRTEAYIRFDKTEEYNAYSDEYIQFIDNQIEEIERLVEHRPAERLEELRAEIDEDLEEGRLEIEDARNELAEAEQELIDAREELDDGWAEYEEGLNEFEEESANARNEISARRQEIEDGRVQLTEAQQELGNAQTEIDSGWAELERNRQQADFPAREQQIESGRKQLQDGQAELENAQREIDAARVQLEEERAAAEANLEPLRDAINEIEMTVEESRAAIAEGFQQIDQRRTEINETYDEASLEEQQQFDRELQALDEAESLLQAQLEELEGQADSQIVPLEEQLTQAESQLEEGFSSAEAELEQAQDEIDAGNRELQSRERELIEGEQQLELGMAELSNAEVELEVAQQEVDAGQSELQIRAAELNEGEQQLNSAESELEAELASVQEELNQGLDELEEAEEEYAEGFSEFEDERQNAESEIADAEQELVDAEEELSDLEEPEYFINDRGFFSGYDEFGENAERIGSIATIFPLFFFLLAALISLTTMTRMVDEGRNQIGTMKALGYTNKDISLKYFVYAFIATILGGLIGLAIGFSVFPRIIMDAYSSMYNLPTAQTTFFWSYSTISLLGALLATGVSTLVSVRSLLKNKSAELLRPKAPKKGKRIIFEYIPFLWNRFTFTQKVASRNLFRYKRRMLMTVFGVSGCTALLLTGFGLSDSISDIGDIQFGEINQYQAIVVENPDADEEQMNSYEEALDELNEIDDELVIHQENATAEENGSSQPVNIMVPNETERMEEFVVLRDQNDENLVHDLPNEGVIITEKLSTLFDLSVGDTLKLVDGDNQEFEVEIAAIVEHYMQHYVYFSPEAYQSMTGEEAEFSSRMLKYDSEVLDDNEIGQVLTSEEAVQGVVFATIIHEALQDSMDSLDVVTIVLIVSAGALALVVLYNLTNINVSERIRELSTIKVLGFFDREVTMYVYRENFVLTIMGILVGLLLGVLLHQFVITTAEVDIMMFSRTIRLSSYLYASLMTFLFSVFVMIIMHFKLKNVDMIEALKTQD